MNKNSSWIILSSIFLMGYQTTTLVSADEINASTNQNLKEAIQKKQSFQSAAPGAMTKNIKDDETHLPIYDKTSSTNQNFQPIIPEEYQKTKFTKGKKFRLS